MGIRKVVINICFGGFSLSPLAVKKIAERQGKNCHFFKSIGNSFGGNLVEISLEEANSEFVWYAYSIPVPPKSPSDEEWRALSDDERLEFNRQCDEVSLDSCHEKRDDHDLVAVVEELGDEAGGSCAHLKVVEIPDNVEWQIKEYDGSEHIAEVHRIWC